MSFVIYKTSGQFCQSLTSNLDLRDTFWIAFGEEALLVSSKADLDRIDSSAYRFNTSFEKNRIQSSNNNTSKLYLVGQKGRLFQQEHPNVPVLIDKGRFLVVELDDNSLKSCQKGDEPCYGLKLIENNTIAFQEPSLDNFRITTVDSIQTIVDKVSKKSLETNLSNLVSWSHRFSTSSFYGEAANWAKEQLENLEYEVKLTEIDVGAAKSQNIIAQKIGTGEVEKNLILVVAHLDSINIRDIPDGIAPGADDNGSGSVGLLEIAKIFHDLEIKHDLRLILFGGEEQGLFGSRDYLNSLNTSERERISIVLNMDMIGVKNTEELTVLLEGADISQSLIDALTEAGSTYTNLKIQTSLNPFASDHVPFIEAGIPAVLTIEGSDSSNNNIHSDNDKIDFIDFELMIEIIRMNVAFLASIVS